LPFCSRTTLIRPIEKITSSTFKKTTINVYLPKFQESSMRLEKFILRTA
jgi:hypothetical protein